jgi:hypothetical protein
MEALQQHLHMLAHTANLKGIIFLPDVEGITIKDAGRPFPKLGRSEVDMPGQTDMPGQVSMEKKYAAEPERLEKIEYIKQMIPSLLQKAFHDLSMR